VKVHKRTTLYDITYGRFRFYELSILLYEEGENPTWPSWATGDLVFRYGRIGKKGRTIVKIKRARVHRLERALRRKRSKLLQKGYRELSEIELITATLARGADGRGDAPISGIQVPEFTESPVKRKLERTAAHIIKRFDDLMSHRYEFVYTLEFNAAVKELIDHLFNYWRSKAFDLRVSAADAKTMGALFAELRRFAISSRTGAYFMRPVEEGET